MVAAIALLFVLSSATIPPASVAELSEAITQPQLSGPPIALQKDEYSIGGLRLELGNGSVYPVRVGDRTVGLFFAGRGGVSFTSDQPMTLQSFRLNVRRATQLSVDDGVVSATLNTALILDSRLGLSAAGGEATAVPETVAKQFARHLDRFDNDRHIAIENRLAQALLDPAAGAVVAIQMQTNKDDLLFLHDEIRRDEATIFSMQRYANDSALRGWRYPQPLATEPLTGDWLRPSEPRFSLRHIELEVVNGEEAQMALEVEETFEIRARLETLELSLWSETFHRRKAHEVVLETVSLGDGTPLDFSHRDGDLVVQLERAAEPGERIALQFSIGGDILHRPGGHSYWWLPIGAWLPLPPRLDAKSYTVHGVVRVAPPFLPFGMGTTVRRWEERGLSCLEFELDEPVQFAVVLAGKYHSYSETRGDQTIILSSYAFAQDEPMRQVAEQVFELIDFYEGLLGEFPYSELNILEINAFGFGIAPPGVVYLTAEGFDPGPAGRSFRGEPNMRLAHEIGHMWWGHQAQIRKPEDQWLSESIAEYVAAVALEALVSRGRFKDAMRDWREEAGNTKELASIYMANRLVGERAAFDRRNLLYAKGPLMLHSLREEIGDEAFFEILRRLATASRFEHVDTAGFIELTAEVSGRDYEPWFKKHLFGLE